MDANTRGGVFGPGGYGGGIFDGSDMGFGGLGGCFDQMSSPVSGFAGLMSATQWKIEANEWPYTVAQAVTGSGGRWTELPAANPGMKKVTVNGQQNLTPWKVGQLVNFPASWVTSAAPAAPATSPAAATPALPSGVSADDWLSMVQGFQFIVNDILGELGYVGVRQDGVVDGTVCGAVKFIADQIKAGTRPESGSVLASAINEPVGGFKFGAVLETVCSGVSPWVAPARAGGAAPAPAPVTPVPPPPRPTGPVEPCQGPNGPCDCYVDYGDKGPHIVQYQKELNVALDAAGFLPIPVTGVWDAATCGAVFELQGKFDITDTLANMCATDFVFPAKCPDMVLPKKQTEEGTTKAGFSTAWIVGGLLGAAAIATVMAMKKKV